MNDTVIEGPIEISSVNARCKLAGVSEESLSDGYISGMTYKVN